MDKRIIFPIFVFEGQDLSVFLCYEDLVNYIEYYDVEDGIFNVYDFVGTPLLLTVDATQTIQCHPSERSSDEGELMSKIYTILNDQDIIKGIEDNEDAVKAMAIALFVERDFVKSSLLNKLKSFLGI